MKKQSGYTLIELLLYISMIGVLLGGVVLFYLNIMTIRAKTQAMNEVDYQATILIESISQAVRNSSSITAPTTTLSGQTLTLSTGVTATNPTSYTLAAGIVYVSEGTSPIIALTNSQVNVSSLTFANLTKPNSKGTIKISFTINKVNASGRFETNYTKTYTTSASIR